ncbi:aconitase/3-isopropylmalate dehydratase large subunit family protein [Pseudonocardia sp. MH-G8]|uniref:3-isopropylmalate dehydratase large subunit n=1 Tax=Pseudonocardia sp. MH-G8 TaxID=1854588 RepID=UPI000BA071EF|nr:aconitase/3-isopropylmalate dehydratase large subunit family protein [Pseudonocardia sp. MH-G8]OZM78059.1 3-isopropylmalate dehydratase [Pseudonocardia sp. MH-G8]
MAGTLIEKVLARAAGRDAVRPGDIVVCDVDMTVLLDIQFLHDRLLDVVAVHDRDRLAIVMDHAVPAPGLREAEAGTHAREFAARHGVEKFFDVGRHGIVHQVLAEQGLALPGTLVACTDSHTCAAGAYSCAARGLGPAEILQIVCTGTTWHRVPPTIRYELTGAPHSWINGKDLFLHIAGEFGDATNCALEYGGPGLGALSMADRRTIATQGAEVGADFSIFPADRACLEFVASVAPDAPMHPVLPDPDATYAEVREIDLSALEPMIAQPGTVIHNTRPVSAFPDVAIDQAFIGSCANGQLADLATAAEIVRGQRVAPGVRLIVTPASQAVYLDAVRLGYVETLVEAGAVVTNSTCGACFGYHMGVVGPGEVCLTASTRNFTGRMGSREASIYMASPATVAVSALRGRISDVRDTAQAGAAS